ncbi:hypothetical protein FJY63_14250 [Candidatus Sumerlaeota bacterium]|nr:hypothetical protein [Candidatus Sumerlaeota bacterium]
MPGGCDGRKLAGHLRESRPGLRVLFCSGHSPDFAGGWMPEEEEATFLPKPFTPQGILSAVADCLRP